MDQHLKDFARQFGYVVLASLIPVIFACFISSMDVHVAKHHTPIQMQHMTHSNISSATSLTC